MKVIPLKDNCSIKYIIHIADVHIRLQKRQDEYRIVFERLYNQIQNIVNSHTDTVIYLAGDIAHTKTDMSPEQADLLQDFLKSLCRLAPVIMITGNHDCNLNNKNRLDALQPIVNAINEPNLFYLKDSGLYMYGNVLFTVMSVFDNPSTYIKYNDIKDIKAEYKIALHHGAVNGSRTSIGFELVNDNVNLKTFEGYDYTLLGDIHKFQFLDEDKRVAYASSLIQQDHGESLEDHGFILWNLEFGTSTYVEIENDYGYITVEVEYGNIISTPKWWPKKSRLKIKSYETSKASLQAIITSIRSFTEIISVSIQRVKQQSKSTDQTTGTIEVQNVRDIEVQNKLITEYLMTYHDIDDESLLDGVRYVNRVTNSNLEKFELPRHSTYILKKFEFSNVFSYGENNVINFQEMGGIYGLFAQNRSGKSSILDSLLFCMFDKCSKTSLATHVLNNRSNSFKLKLNFELNGIDYYIERYGTKKEKTGHVPVLVDFYYFDDLGNKILLNGEERDDTNKIIKKYIGKYEDFILTSISTQNNNTGFIEMTQSKRKELLSQFLDISIFEDLYKLASEEIKDVSAVLKNYQKQNLYDVITNAEQKIETLNKELKPLNKEYNELINRSKIINEKIESLNKTLIPLADNIDHLNLDTLLEQESNFKNIELKLSEEASTAVAKIGALKQRLTEEELALELYSIEDINKAYNAVKEAKNKKHEYELLLTSLKQQLKYSNDNLERLKDLEYDENCSYCINNIFVKDAIKTKDTVLQLQEKIAETNRLLEEIESSIENDTSEQQLSEYNKKLKSINDLKLSINNVQVSIENLKFRVTNNINSIKDIETKKELYFKNKKSIEFNQRTEEEILKHRNDLETLNRSIEDLSLKINSVNTNIIIQQTTIEQTNSKIDEMIELERKFKYYELYLIAVTRNGVPYDIIKQVLPQIEAEVNNVLSQLVDFTISFQSDDKNINTYIVYDDDNVWPIELISGMEKFISSLAIRTALISITSLPKPNFIAIDEGFTQLDSEQISSVYMLFTYLKSQFDFIIIISHLELLRDMVDKFIDVRKDNNGYSKVEVM